MFSFLTHTWKLMLLMAILSMLGAYSGLWLQVSNIFQPRHNTKLEVVDLLRGWKVSMCSSTLTGLLFKLCRDDTAAVSRKQRW